MRKTVKLILIGVIIIAVLSIFKNESIEDIKLSENLQDIIPPIELNDARHNMVNFSVCDPEDSFSLDTGLGSGGIKVVGPKDDHCLVETRYEIEGGYFINECRIPQKLGEMQFEETNFDELAPYCQLKNEGNALLELN